MAGICRRIKTLDFRAYSKKSYFQRIKANTKNIHSTCLKLFFHAKFLIHYECIYILYTHTRIPGKIKTDERSAVFISTIISRISHGNQWMFCQRYRVTFLFLQTRQHSGRRAMQFQRRKRKSSRISESFSFISIVACCWRERSFFFHFSLNCRWKRTKGTRIA